MNKRLRIRVGLSDADIVGSTNKALQAAVDYVGKLGGGIVEIGPGVYLMEDSLHLHSGVHVIGNGEKTVLKKADGASSLLATDGDYGEEQITVSDDIGLAPGKGVTIGYEGCHGFHTTVATVLAQIDSHTFTINKPLGNDYVISRKARAQTTFPIISGYYLNDVIVENLAIDGNAENNPPMGGCRGAGVFFYRVNNARISNVKVTEFNGDGISYQQSHDVVVEDCTILGCKGHGFHPGSGSQRTIVRRCVVHNSGGDGMFVCWRVQHGLFEDNEFVGSGATGISIGHKDTDNVFRRNLIAENRSHGVLFRNEPVVLAAHRNRFEENRVINNGTGEDASGFYVGGETCDITIVGNVIADTRSPAERTQRYGVYVGAKARNVRVEDNEMSGHVVQDVFYEAKQA
ncbi:MAG: hypothetical protein GX162_03875 [Firmicutes bacterium]|nr:hypothetical protein [Bacillota bacterium]